MWMDRVKSQWMPQRPRGISVTQRRAGTGVGVVTAQHAATEGTRRAPPRTRVRKQFVRRVRRSEKPHSRPRHFVGIYLFSDALTSMRLPGPPFNSERSGQYFPIFHPDHGWQPGPGSSGAGSAAEDTPLQTPQSPLNDPNQKALEWQRPRLSCPSLHYYYRRSRNTPKCRTSSTKDKWADCPRNSSDRAVP